ncbi:hypothetical protein B0H11DRAFT_2213731 [Mycena galericulata]|nr:hypothetical protein B0H11DRAFT_2213731 [Mycena galericulata]
MGKEQRGGCTYTAVVLLLVPSLDGESTTPLLSASPALPLHASAAPSLPRIRLHPHLHQHPALPLHPSHPADSVSYPHPRTHPAPGAARLHSPTHIPTPGPGFEIAIGDVG